MQIVTCIDEFRGHARECHKCAFAVIGDIGTQRLGLERILKKNQRREQPLQQLEFSGMLFDTGHQKTGISLLIFMFLFELLGMSASVVSLDNFSR